MSREIAPAQCGEQAGGGARRCSRALSVDQNTQALTFTPLLWLVLVELLLAAPLSRLRMISWLLLGFKLSVICSGAWFGWATPMVTCSLPLAPLLNPIEICSPGVRLPRLSTISDPLAEAVELAAAGSTVGLLEVEDKVEGVAAEDEGDNNPLRFTTTAGWVWLLCCCCRGWKVLANCANACCAPARSPDCRA